MSKGNFRTFLTGALVGVGLGVLFAPKEGNETKADLKSSFQTLVDTIKDIDIEETKNHLLEKVSEIKNELSLINEDTARELAKEKMGIIKDKCTEIMDVAKEKQAYLVEKAALRVQEGATEILEDFLKELEVHEEKTTKKVQKTTPKKKSKNYSKTGKKSSKK